MTTETRTAETVRLGVAALERALVELNDPTISLALRELERILPGIEGTLARQEGLAVGEVLHAVRAFRLREELAEELHLLEVGVRLRLIPALRNRQHVLEQELTALQPPEPEAAGLFERVVQAAQHALSFGHPA